jgi:hypothetical protein
MRIRQGYDLAAVAWVCQDFLITSHGGIENDFGDTMTIGADGDALEDGTVRQSQNCMGRRIGSFREK